MPTFLTVKEAAERTGRSPSSIRRLLRPITNDDAHPDRVQVQPSVEEVRQLRPGQSFAWRLSEELIQKYARLVEEQGSGGATSRPSSTTDAQLIAVLREQLASKDGHIAELTATINKHADNYAGLSERLRESNVLLANMQQRLALSPPRDHKKSRKPKQARAAAPEKGTAIATTPEKPKRRWFRLFGQS